MNFTKKVILVLLAFVLTLSLCSCSNTKSENNAPIPYNVRKSANESGNFALLDEYAHAVTDHIYSKIDLYENFAAGYVTSSDGSESKIHILDYAGNQIGREYDTFDKVTVLDTAGDDATEETLGTTLFAASYSDGTRTVYNVSLPDPHFSEESEMNCTQTYILDIYGKPVFDEPFEYYHFSPKSDNYYIPYNQFKGIKNGSQYVYEVKDGTFTLMEEHPAGETDIEAFGYKETVYYYINGDAGYGLNDSDGNEVIPPIHSSVEVLSEDRFILFTGYYKDSPYLYYPCEYISHLTDEKGNILADYSDIYTYKLDGSVWIAYYDGDENHYYSETRFGVEDGYLEQGYWFIDKDGNRLSPCIKQFDSFTPAYDLLMDSDEVLSAIGENDEKLELHIRDFIFD